MKLLLIIWIISLHAEGLENKFPVKGTAVYKFFFTEIYQATLWTETAQSLYDKKLVLELKYKRSFQGSDILKQTKKELEKAGVDKNLIENGCKKLQGIFPDVNKDDAISAQYAPEKGITFYLNSKNKLGEINDNEFSKAFLNIWLGEKTSDPTMRDKLLGRKLD